MQSNLNTLVFIIEQIKHYFSSMQTKTASNKYSFKYHLLAIKQNLDALAYCEHFHVMITTVVQLIRTHRINSENSL